MTPEDVTFREPDFGEQEPGENMLQRSAVDGEAGGVTFTQPDFVGHQEWDRPPAHAHTGESDIIPKTTAKPISRPDRAAEDAQVSRDSVSNNGAESSQRRDWVDKDDALSPTPSLALELAPTQQSVHEGEVENVVQKRTYLHRPSKARIRRHSSLARCFAVMQNIWTMISTFPYWDMAFLSSFGYSVGSAMFIIDGAFAFGPLASPGQHWPEGEDKYAGPILFFFGAVFCYEIGAVVAYLEAINDGCFAGVAMKRFWIEGSDEDKKKLLDAKLHAFFGHIIPHHHHHDSEDANVNDIMGEKTRAEMDVDTEAAWRTVTNENTELETNTLQNTPSRRDAVDHGPGDQKAFNEYMTWRWWPRWQTFKSYHIREVGYVACSIQLLGATLYGVAGIVVLPGVLSSLAWWQKLAAFWIPQVVASCCFLTAAIMFTIEAQDVWNRPTPWTVRWWIGGWAAIGSTGFLLCACFGLGSHKYTWCEYQSDLSSMWGSAGYLFSALLQWYEAVSAGPVLAFPNNRTPVLMRKAKVRTQGISDCDQEG